MAYSKVLILQWEFRCPSTQIKARGSIVYPPESYA